MKSRDNDDVTKNATAAIDDTTFINHDGIIELKGYWVERFKTTHISTTELQKVVWLNMSNDCEYVESTYDAISLRLLEFLPNIKDTNIQYRNITDWHYLTSLKQLKNLCIAFKEIDTELAGYIAQLPRLGELHLTRLNISDCATLSQSKNYRRLRLHKIEGLDKATIQLFGTITQLEVDSISEDLTAGIGKLTKLRKLELEHTPVASLDFLEELKSLKEFKCTQRTNDDNISMILPKLEKMTSFEYPLRDLAVLEQCPKIVRICVDGEGCENLDTLKGRHVESFVVLHAKSEEEAKRIIAEAQGYCGRFSSYGYTMPWKK